ncbi:MAG: hypothetical protein ACYDHM_03790 [Acidiferrobacterales bacterium]
MDEATARGRAVHLRPAAVMGAQKPGITLLNEETLLMAYSYEELRGKTVAELREIASGLENEAVKGYTQLNKDHLLVALCKALGIDMHEHHKVIGVDKSGVKVRIRELKKKRDAALVAKNHDELRSVLRRIHALKRVIRRAMV